MGTTDVVDAQRLAHTFVALADTLAEKFDVVEFLQLLVDRAVELLEVTAAGLMLVDVTGALRVMAASTGAMQELEEFQQEHGEGPCVDCYRGGVPVAHPQLAAAGARWPRFSPVAVGAGFASVHAMPMRLRQQILGAFNVFHAKPGGIGPVATEIAQAMVDVATIGLIQERSGRAHDIALQQLQHALDSRVAIEQAKGFLAARHRIDPTEAFKMLRASARSQARGLTDMAQAVIDGSAGNLLDAGPRPKPRPPS